jgi:hypothetical protein
VLIRDGQLAVRISWTFLFFFAPIRLISSVAGYVLTLVSFLSVGLLAAVERIVQTFLCGSVFFSKVIPERCSKFKTFRGLGREAREFPSS